MILTIPVTKDNFEMAFIEVLNPIMKLTFTEKQILNEYIKLYKAMLEMPEEDIITTLASQETRIHIRQKLKITEHAYNNHICNLKKKQVLIEGRLNHTITANCLNSNIKVIYNLQDV